jgi:hypothetical protein
MAQTGIVTTTAGRAHPLPVRAAPVRPRARHRVHLARWVLHGIWRMAVLGALIGVGLVRLDPMAAAVAGLIVAVIGVLLSEVRLAGPDRAVLMAAAGMMTPALAYLIAQLVHLL